MKFTHNAELLLIKRYCKNNESPYEVYTRVAKTIGEPIGLEKEFLKMMREKKFMPASPILLNAGPKLSNFYQPCVVLPIEDDMNSILETLKKTGMITKLGGGCGYNISHMRERNSFVSAGGISSGPLSFMKIYNSLIEEIKQGGVRKGALIATMWYNHPDIFDFIDAKINTDTYNNFNFSVMLDDEFMNAVKSESMFSIISKSKGRQKVRADELFYKIAFAAEASGDPGVQFYNAINKDNPLFPEKPIEASNPCGEEYMFPYESCALISVNLNEHIIDNDIDMNQLEETIKLATKFLLSSNELCVFPYPEMKEMAEKYKRIGVGITGFADALIKMNIMYDSKETLEVIDRVGSTLKKITDKYAPDSISKRAIAPDGSRSILLNASSSIEPVYRRKYIRYLSFGEILEERSKSEFMREAYEINPEWRLKINSQWQKYIDNGMSTTINLPYGKTYNDIKKIYLKAWELNLKGVTVFVDKTKDSVYRECKSGNCDL